MDWKARFKNYGFWVSIIAQVAFIVGMLNIVDTSQLDAWQKVFVSVLELLVILGIINNPTDGKGFGDSPK